MTTALARNAASKTHLGEIRMWKPVFAFFLFAFIIASAGYVIFQRHKEDIKRNEQGKLGGIAKLKIEQINSWLADLKGDIQAITQDPQFLEMAERCRRHGRMDGKVEARLSGHLLSLHRTHPDDGYSSISLFDDQARPCLSTSSHKQIGEDEKQYSLNSLHSGQALFFDTQHESAGTPGTVRIGLSVPIMVKNEGRQRAIGAVLAEIDPKYFLFPQLRDWPTSSTSAENMLVKRSGDEIIFLSKLRFRGSDEPMLRLPLTQNTLLASKALLGKEGLLEGVDYRGIPVIGVVSKISSTPWAVVSKIDQAEIYKPVDYLSKWVMALSALFFLVGSGVFVYWGRQQILYTRLVKAQNESREEVRRLGEALKHSGEATVLVDCDSRIVYVNPAFTHLFGYPLEEVAGKRVAEIFETPETDTAQPHEIFSAVKKHGIFHDEVLRRTKDGRLVTILLTLRPVLDEQGGAAGYVANMLDLTERKKMEEALRMSLHQQREILDNIPDPAWLKDRDGHYQAVNAAWCRFSGRQPDEVIGKTDFELLPSEIAGNFQEADLVVMGPNRSFRQEQHLMDAKAKEYWFDTIIVPLTNERGETMGTTGIARDISGRKQAEEDMRRHRKFMWQVIDTDPNLIFVKDDMGQYLMINQAVADYYGLPVREVVGKNICELNPGHDAPPAFLDMDREVIEGRCEIVRTIPSRRPDGQERWYLTIKRPLISPEGAVNVLGIAVDITEQKLSESRLAESYLELQRLSLHLENLREDERAKIARDLHDEMGSLLVALKMRVAWLASNLPSGMPHLADEVANISNLVTDAIGSVRQITSQLRPSLREGFGLAATIEDYVKRFRLQAGVECNLALPEEELPLDANQSATLFRILQESLNNIAKHAQASRVRITLARRDKTLLLEVEDNGAGFDTSVHNERSFGLIGIRERAMMMGGKARISSTPGKGTRVSVTLPLGNQQEP